MTLSYGETWPEIANRALGRLSAGSIQDLDEGTTLAGYCSLFMGEALSGLLSCYDWSFAKKRVQLAADVTTPAYDYDYRYALPNDFLRIVEVSPTDTEYAFEGRYILTDETEIWITYIATIETLSTLSQSFKKALSLGLAFLLTTPLTSNDSLAARIAQEYQEAKEQAVKDDARLQYQIDATGHAYYDETR